MADQPSMFDMLKQARELQKKMKQAEKKVASAEVTADAGGGMVTVVMTGKMLVRRITIEPSLVERGDVRMIQDLVTSAVNSAVQKAQQMMADEMKQVTGGINLPGMF